MSSRPAETPAPTWLRRLALATDDSTLGRAMGDSTLLRVLRSFTDWAYDRWRGWIQGSVIARQSELLSIGAVCLLFLASPFVGTGINAALVLLAFGLVLVRLLAQPDTRAEFSSLDALVILYVAVHVLATGFSPYIAASAKGFAKMIVYWLAYFSFRQILQSRRAMFAVLMALFLAGTLEATYGLYQWKIGVEPLAAWEDPETLDPLTRVYSTLMNPNLLAGYLLTIFPLALTAAARWRLPYRIVPLVGLPIVPLCIFFTYCRSAYVAIAIMVVIFGSMAAWLGRERLAASPQLRGGLIAAVIGGLLLVAARIATSPSLQTRVLSIFTLRGHSSNSFRVNVWTGVLHMVHDNWLIGVGIGNSAFRKVYSLYMISGFEALGAYNIFLEVLAEMGVIGLAVFCWLLASYAARNVLTFRLGQGESRWWAVAVLAALIGMGVMGMVDTVYYRPAIQLQFWLLLAMTVAISPSARSSKIETAGESEPENLACTPPCSKRCLSLANIPVDDSIKRILVVNFGGIGDEILFFPVIQSLREAYPGAHLTSLVEPRCEGIMRFNPAIDEVVTFDAKHKPSRIDFLKLVWRLRRAGFDLAITAGSSPVMALLVWLTGARYRIGYKTHRYTWMLTQAVPLDKQQYAAHMYHDLVGYLGKQPRLPQMTLGPADRDWAQEFLAANGRREGRPVVVFHPGVSRLSIEKKIIKGWAPERWVELGRRLTARDVQVVLAGGPDDEEVIRLIRDTGNFPFVEAYGKTKGLGQLAALIAQADAVVAVDSAPMHVGVAVGTPTVAIFGPTDPQKLLPAGTAHVAVAVEGLACRPCLWDRRQTSCDELNCLKDLTVDRVEAAVLEILPAQHQVSG